jgi:hypothetical protein
MVTMIADYFFYDGFFQGSGFFNFGFRNTDFGLKVIII